MLNPIGIPATAYANGIETIPPPIMVATMEAPVSVAEFSAFTGSYFTEFEAALVKLLLSSTAVDVI